MRHLLFLSLLVAPLPTIASAQVDVEGFVPVDRPDTYDGIFIGTVQGPAIVQTLPDVRGDLNLFAVQLVCVEDSSAFRPGTLVEVHFQYKIDPSFDRSLSSKLISQENAMRVGSRVLIVGSKNVGRSLERPWPYSTPGATRRYDLGSSKPAAYSFAFFETREERLPQLNDPMWRLLTGVANAVRGTDGPNVDRIRAFLEDVRLPTWKNGYVEWKGEERLSRVFSDAVADQKP